MLNHCNKVSRVEIFSALNQVYDFTFDANANELFALSDGQFHGFDTRQFNLIAPSGATILPIEQTSNTMLFRIPHFWTVSAENQEWTFPMAIGRAGSDAAKQR